jgi:transposase-like protein
MQAFSVADLARHYGKAPGTIGRWISESHIEGSRDPLNKRRKLYPLDAVQRAYDKRHALCR